MAKKQKQVVLGVTGSIAAYKAAEIIRRLKDAGYRVSVIMTEAAEEFITPLTLATLSQEKVYRKMFEGQEDIWDIDHISLAQAADVVLIAPATANVIAKIASGLADDLLTCTVLATKALVLVAPAMNEGMFSNKIVQENCAKLEKLGVKIIAPEKGKLACGDEGTGRLADVDVIVTTVKTALS